ncbi:hypothetical protein NC651_031839 [Populus alba x Populus x berolinensis]|nr:hypothetical protein NC651_031839 [Populus alba x Populus x berolinensis]
MKFCVECTMDNEKGESSGGDNAGANDGTRKKLSQDGAEALKECLEENKGDHNKCKSKIDALESSSAPRKRPLLPLILKSDSLTDFQNRVVVVTH